MTNENNNINELVSDRNELPAELEAVTWQQSPSSTYQDAGTESDASTFDITKFADLDAQRSVAISELKSDLRSQSETISELQFDIEQVRAKRLGLETEIKAREEITADLNTELESARRALQRKDKLLQKRDLLIKSLKVKSLEGQFRKHVTSSLGEADSARSDLAEHTGQLASRDRLVAELREQLQRTESYADGIRQQLHDHITSVDELQVSCDALQLSLTRANERRTHLEQAAKEQKMVNRELSDQLKESSDAHASEMRMLRFELGEAQETVAQHELVTEQLAMDLVDSRGFKVELERMLSVSETHNHA